jgi:hypothetical protein
MVKITLSLTQTDLEFLIRALDVYLANVDLLNTEALRIDEDTLSDMNNDAEYLEGLRRHLHGLLPSETK